MVGDEDATSTLLKVKGLTVEFERNGVPLRAVDGVSFELSAGSVTGIVGESGSGKSTVANALTGLVSSLGGSVVAGSIEFDGRDVTAATQEEWRKLRGERISAVFQDPHTSLNPSFTVGNQLLESARKGQTRGAAARLRRAGDARSRALKALQQVHLPDAERRLRNFPHELSGGMKQRVVSAAAIVNQPDLLIADEPTTALDVTTQAQYLSLLRELQSSFNMAVLVISHDFGVIAELCDEVVVMYAGRVVEQGSASSIFDDPQHPYTKGLLESRFLLDTDEGPRFGSIAGQPPQLWDLPQGCNFRPRCAEAHAACLTGPGSPIQIESGHYVECHARGGGSDQ